MHRKRQPTDIRVWTGKRIKELRLKHGWTQPMLAEHAKVSRIYLSELENGHKAAAITVLEKIACALEVGLEEFFRGS
jgi:transcriptional regulator with XRE-family HTH domain